MKLVAQHVAGGAQRAAKAIGFAQQPRLAIGTAVAEFRKLQRHQSEMAQPGRQFGNAAVVWPEHAKRSIAAAQRVSIGEKTLCWDDHWDALGNRLVLAEIMIAILDDLAVLNERHRRAPGTARS